MNSSDPKTDCRRKMGDQNVGDLRPDNRDQQLPMALGGCRTINYLCPRPSGSLRGKN
jgi:hypothetical protein